jgi:ABC-type multidrug transport system fused ATPase/permease subunit
LAENIGLGYPECSSDIEMIEEASEEGGATEFMGKLKNGIQTSLQPHIETIHYNLSQDKTHPLYSEMEEMEKTIDISGGEKQRVVAYV